MSDYVGEGKRSLAGVYLTAVRDFAASKGVKATDLLQGSDITLDILVDPPQRIGELSMYQIAKNLVDVLDDPISSSFEMAQAMNISTHGALGVAAMGARNLREASNLIAQYSVTRNNTRDWQMEETDEYICLRMIRTPIYDFESDEAVRIFFDIATLVNIEMFARVFLREDDLPGRGRINLDSAPPAGVHEVLVHENIEFHFNMPISELCLPKEWVDIVVNPTNPELATLATDRCQDELQKLTPEDLLAEVRRRIRQATNCKMTIHDMAQQFFVSTSTLQRRLKEENTTYQALKDEERLNLAKELLESGERIEDISERCGFNDTSNFTKSFKNWTGLTPNSYRKKSS